MTQPGSKPSTPSRKKAQVKVGMVGIAVRENIARIRAERRLSLRELSARTKPLGGMRGLTPSAINEIELGQRRVDVDDLVVLAQALGVAPVTLLMPLKENATAAPTSASDPVRVSIRSRHPARIMWAWLRGDSPLSDVEDPASPITPEEAHLELIEPRDPYIIEGFRRRAQPEWVRTAKRDGQ